MLGPYLSVFAFLAIQIPLVLITEALVRIVTLCYRKFRSDPMGKLTYQQRMEVLHLILNHELENLGVDLPIQVIATSLPNGIRGSYQPITGIIAINKFLLIAPNTMELFSVVAHEAKHVSQFTTLLTLNYAKWLKMTPQERADVLYLHNAWKQYKTVQTDGYRAYRNQVLERQARQYATRRKRYYAKNISSILDAHLKNEEERKFAHGR